MASLYVISAPSGAGKTSLVKALVESTPGLLVSVSHTTRPPRPGEENGEHYHFVSGAEFDALREEGRFLESARVFDHQYGTSRDWVAERLAEGLDVILEIDWQGARQVRNHLPESVSVFILPPSRDELQRRLRGRGQDSEEVVARRMRDAVAELRHFEESDYLVMNEDFDQALAELRCIVLAGRLGLAEQCHRHGELLAELLA